MVAKLDLSILSKKVGPLPVGAWIAVAGGGLYVGRMWSARATGAGRLPTTGLGGLAGSGAAGVDGSAPPTPADADTNDAWARRVITELIAEGVEPTSAQRAVVNFLNGYPLTLSESFIVDRALMIGGVPPEGVPPVTIDNGDDGGNYTPATPTPTPQQPAVVTQPAPYTPSYSGGASPQTVGVIPTGAPYGYADFPTTTVAGSVVAPAGGSFMYGQWSGDQLVSATYQLPDGSFASVHV